MPRIKDIINKYHLKVGAIVATILPGLFVFSEKDSSQIVTRFICSFLIIFLLWSINFFLVDFKRDTFSKKKYFFLKMPFSIILALLLSIALYFIIGLLIDTTGTMLSQISGRQFYSFKSWFFLCLRIIFFNGLIMLIKYLFDNYEEKKQLELEMEILKKETVFAQHEVLKQQVSPHFLFNTLNTLKSLVKANPELAAKFISEMALVYRYMLVNTDKNEVSIREEIEFVKSYLYLLQIRFGESIVANIHIPEAFLNKTMPPNTIQLLIENSVKHNSFSASKPLTIHIFYECNYLILENNLRKKKEYLPSSNFGLRNINSRYLMLKGKQIIIKNEGNFFQVFLPIE
ncbi:MAG: histidine kinase [Ferruginibacter sp.]